MSIREKQRERERERGVGEDAVSYSDLLRNDRNKGWEGLP